MTLNPSTYFQVEIEGPNAGTEYDVVNASGTVDLNNAILEVLLNGYTPAIGTKFTIINANTITGTFASLPNGSVFTDSDGYRYRVTYETVGLIDQVVLEYIGTDMGGSSSSTGDTPESPNTGLRPTSILLAPIGGVVGVLLLAFAARRKIAR